MTSSNEQYDLLERLKHQFDYLVFSPGSLPTAGRQENVGNHYPNAESYSLDDHFLGTATYAFDLVHSDQGGSLVKLGAVDCDEGVDALDRVWEAYDYAESLGLSCAVAFSGGKGLHLYVYSHPVSKSDMVVVLKKIRDEFGIKGEVIPGEGIGRIKVAPCFHQAAGRVSYLLRRDEPVKFLESRDDLRAMLEDQERLLASIEPTPANVVISLAQYFGGKLRDSVRGEILPNLEGIESLPPCIAAFVQRGGSASLGRFDQNSLTLRTYCNNVGLGSSQSDELAHSLTHRTNPEIETSKGVQDKVRHWESTLNSPSSRKPFSCAFMLRGKKELGFDCSACPVRPTGIEGNSASSFKGQAAFQMLPNLSERALAYFLQSGNCPPAVHESIFPNKLDRAIIRAISLGHRTAVDIINYWRRLPDKEQKPYYA